MFYEQVVKRPKSLENTKLFIGIHIYNKYKITLFYEGFSQNEGVKKYGMHS